MCTHILTHISIRSDFIRHFCFTSYKICITSMNLPFLWDRNCRVHYLNVMRILSCSNIIGLSISVLCWQPKTEGTMAYLIIMLVCNNLDLPNSVWCTVEFNTVIKNLHFIATFEKIPYSCVNHTCLMKCNKEIQKKKKKS